MSEHVGPHSLCSHCRMFTNTHLLYKVAVKSHQHAGTSCTCVACKTLGDMFCDPWQSEGLQTKSLCVVGVCVCLWLHMGNPSLYAFVIDAASLQIKFDVVRMFNCIRVRAVCDLLIWEMKEQHSLMPRVNHLFIMETASMRYLIC